ncbi:MAG: hypothetical protein NZM43_05545 [Saprospiraceae bacterium]|nr:hypothetical protein [Saprospiraceae bacterium]MDW8483772.1 hypothetical protein [Saprospiraceae bacterium]
MNLFEFFQKQEALLQEAPPERVWQRLQARLEQRRKRRKRQRIRFLQFGVLFISLMLLLLAAIFMWYLKRQEGL